MLHNQPTRLLALVLLLFIPLAFALLIGQITPGRSPAASQGIAYANSEPDTTPTEGFLQLPFKPLPGQSYTGLDNVMSWFDHEYPLVSIILFPQSGLEPPIDGIGNTVMIYTGEEKISCFGPPRPDCFRLSGHNGLDYENGVTAGTVISAAHSGTVTLPPFSPCAQASVNVTTDDGRYQTRYLHLDPDVTTAQYVQAGDYIGRVGGVITRCIRYPHLHFTVYYDRDGDGHFITDEKVDPYGWQPIGQTDPWTTTFQDRLGDWHTGTPSEWLWSFSPPARQQLAPDEPARLTTHDGVSLLAPAGAVDNSTTLAYFVAPEPTSSYGETALWRIGTPFKLIAADESGRPLDALKRPARLTIPYRGEDVAFVEEASLTIYWWDGERGAWVARPTTLDLRRQQAWTEVSQLGLYSLRGRAIADGKE